MKKGIRGHDVCGCGVTEICTKCRNMGFKYIQLVLEKSVGGFKQGMFSEEYAQKLKKELGGVKTAVLGSYINLSSSDPEELNKGISAFKEKIKYASILNPIVVGTETGFYGEHMSEELNSTEEAYAHLLNTVKELTIEAEKYNVNIGIEGVHCYVINTPERMKRLMDDVNSDNIRVIFDPVNYLNGKNYRDQDSIINNTFRLLHDKIDILHIKDFVAENGGIRQAVPGEGMLNYKLIFENLAKYNLDVPLISEEYSVDEAVTGFSNLMKIQREIL